MHVLILEIYIYIYIYILNKSSLFGSLQFTIRCTIYSTMYYIIVYYYCTFYYESCYKDTYQNFHPITMLVLQWSAYLYIIYITYIIYMYSIYYYIFSKSKFNIASPLVFLVERKLKIKIVKK